ncbi:MAG: hypothetical protein A4E70_02429 [Syntrophus sp. PtaU1.Bin005]|nr:MAG: hypothetical protein A4E70_02429 [Syntrophus sp. PtaU1.Bin005]
MLRADILIVEMGGFLHGLVQNPVEPRSEVRLDGPGYPGQPFKGLFEILFDPGRVRSQLFQNISHNAFRLSKKGQQQMLRINALVAVVSGQPLGLLQAFLHLQRKFVKTHRSSLTHVPVPPGGEFRRRICRNGFGNQLLEPFNFHW